MFAALATWVTSTVPSTPTRTFVEHTLQQASDIMEESLKAVSLVGALNEVRPLVAQLHSLCAMKTMLDNTSSAAQSLSGTGDRFIMVFKCTICYRTFATVVECIW
jgi:hypothetical protein